MGVWGWAGWGEKLGELLGLEPVCLVVGGMGWDGLCMLGGGTVVTGSGVLWRERLDERDARRPEGDLVKLC